MVTVVHLGARGVDRLHLAAHQDVGELRAQRHELVGRRTSVHPEHEPAVDEPQGVVVRVEADDLVDRFVRVVGGERWHQRRLWCRQVWLPPDHAHPPRIGDIDDGPPHRAVAAVGKSASALIDNSKLIGLIPAFGPGLTWEPHIVETEDFQTRYIPVGRLHERETVIMESPTDACDTQTGASASRLQKSPSIHSHDFLLQFLMTTRYFSPISADRRGRLCRLAA